MDFIVSGVGVLDKSMRLVGLVAAQPRTLAEMVEATGWSRATVHRLVSALVEHGLLRRSDAGRYALGLHLLGLGLLASEQYPLADAARPALEALRSRTGESVQLYVRDGDARVCVAALESPHGLRTIVPVGAELPLDVGSAGHVLQGRPTRAGWSQSVGEREPGVASVSAPVLARDGSVLAAISVSGPIERLGRSPGKRFGDAVADAASEVSSALP